MRRRISLLRESVFIKKTIPSLVLVAIFSVVFTTSTVLSAGPGTSDQLNRGPTASETGLGPAPFFNHQGPGADFIKAGATTRVYNSYTNGQTEPFVLTVPALPPGAVVVETFISWNYLLNGAPPATDGITVNGHSVTGTLAGSGTPDLCWSKDGTASYMVSGATPWVNPGPAPVFVTIAGATDKAVVGADPNAYGEGLTILVVYDVPANPWRNVDLYKGYASNTSGAVLWTASATLNFTVPYQGGGFHFFLNGLDGQIAGDDFFIDGINRSGQVNGTVVFGDAWQGLLGPSASGVNNMYDHANDDISAFVIAPATKLDISTIGIVELDCVGHSFAAVSFPAEAPAHAIPTLTEWGLIIFGIVLLGFISWVFLKRRKVIGVRS
jgi:hypothetical protein